MLDPPTCGTVRRQVTTKLDGVVRRWQLRKRYGYFEKVVAVRAAAAAAACSMTPPSLPKRKIFGHKNPRYIARLRVDLEAYMRRVVELLHALTCGVDDTPDAEALQHLLGLLDLVAPSRSSSSRQRYNAASRDLRRWASSITTYENAKRSRSSVKFIAISPVAMSV